MSNMSCSWTLEQTNCLPSYFNFSVGNKLREGSYSQIHPTIVITEYHSLLMLLVTAAGQQRLPNNIVNQSVTTGFTKCAA